MDFTIDIAVLVTVGALSWALVTGLKRAVFDGVVPHEADGWRAVWYLTLWAQPIAVALALGFGFRLAAPAWLGPELGARVVWYALAGACAQASHALVRSTIKRKAAAWGE